MSRSKKTPTPTPTLISPATVKRSFNDAVDNFREVMRQESLLMSRKRAARCAIVEAAVEVLSKDKKTLNVVEARSALQAAFDTGHEKTVELWNLSQGFEFYPNSFAFQESTLDGMARLPDIPESLAQVLYGAWRLMPSEWRHSVGATLFDKVLEPHSLILPADLPLAPPRRAMLYAIKIKPHIDKMGAAEAAALLNSLAVRVSSYPDPETVTEFAECFHCDRTPLNLGRIIKVHQLLPKQAARVAKLDKTGETAKEIVSRVLNDKETPIYELCAYHGAFPEELPRSLLSEVIKNKMTDFDTMIDYYLTGKRPRDVPPGFLMDVPLFFLMEFSRR